MDFSLGTSDAYLDPMFTTLNWVYFKDLNEAVNSIHSLKKLSLYKSNFDLKSNLQPKEPFSSYLRKVLETHIDRKIDFWLKIRFLLWKMIFFGPKNQVLQAVSIFSCGLGWKSNLRTMLAPLEEIKSTFWKSKVLLKPRFGIFLGRIIPRSEFWLYHLLRREGYRILFWKGARLQS